MHHDFCARIRMKRLRSLQISTYPFETRCRCLTPSDKARKKNFSGIAPHEVVREKVKSCYAKCVKLCSTDRSRGDAPGVEVIRCWERQTAHFQHPDILCCSLLNISHVHGRLQKLGFLADAKTEQVHFWYQIVKRVGNSLRAKFRQRIVTADGLATH